MRATQTCLFLLVVSATSLPTWAQSEPKSDDQPVKPIRVVVWDERQPAQRSAYNDDYLGNVIAEWLGQQPGLEVKSVALDDRGKGITDEVLDDCNVLIWWGHVRNGDISTKEAQRVVKRIQQGKLSMIALHSAHWATPFVMAMHARARADALRQLSSEDRSKAKVQWVGNLVRKAPKRDAELTPSSEIVRGEDGSILVKIKRPNCCFPAYRNDGKPSTITVRKPWHPIAKGIPKTFTLPHTEMYDEPFHVPKPDQVIFEEGFAGGEHFRSGAVWNIGKGRVFYFRPGHETHSVFAEPHALQIIENAVRWLAAPRKPASVFADRNLVAWCIVPFDAKKRSPAERAEMLKRLGIRKVAYDWRAEHVASFEDEILQYKKHGLEYFAFWAQHDTAFELFKKHGLHPQIWQIPLSPKTGSQEQKVEASAKAMLPLVQKTKALGCKLGLYNHGGWSGEPANLVAICDWLKQNANADHVGIVYNLHHGHGHIDDFEQSLKLMQPQLICLNINGMNDNAQPKIVGVGKGQHDINLLRTIHNSGYRGPIGILDHRNELDAEESLRENLDGLRKLRQRLNRE